MSLKFVCESEESDESVLRGSENEEAEEEEIVIPVKEPRAKPVWTIDEKFDSVEMGMEFVQNQNQWTRTTKNTLLDSYKIYFCCKFSQHKKKNAQNCSSVCVINVLTTGRDSGKCEVSTARLPQSCTNDKILSIAHKEIIREAFVLGTARTSKRINSVLKSKQLSELRSSVITNFIQRLKKALFDSVKTYEEFETWCKGKQEVPADLDSVFVIGFDCVKDKERDSYLRCVLSTKRLLQQGSSITHLHADGTYKLNLHGLPVILIGTTDKNRHFHPLCISVCTNENTADYAYVFQCLKTGVEKEVLTKFNPSILIADAAEAITHGFSAVFGHPKVRIMCWFHVMLNVKKKMKPIKSVEKRHQLRQDICNIHRAPTSSAFYRACELLGRKWSSDPEVTEFLRYFDANWVKLNSGWHYGVAPGYPLTNNALEATNNVIKRDYTVWEKLIFTEFLSKLMEITADWSLVRNLTSPNYKPLVTVVSISEGQKQQAFEWKSVMEVLEIENLSSVYVGAYDTKTRAHLKVTMDLVKLHEGYLKRSNWPDFETFKFHQSNIWRIKYNLEDWNQSTCSCPVFIRDYCCKHWLGIGMKKKKIEHPESTEIRPKPTRGRPKDSENVSSPPPSQAGGSSQRPAHRPQKVGRALEFELPAKRKRGRPPKVPVPASEDSTDGEGNSNPLPVKKPRRKPISQSLNSDRTPIVQRLRSATQHN